MLISKLALLTCGFYLGVTILLEAALFTVAHFKGSAGIFGTYWSWAVLFGVIWFVSFSLSFRIVYHGLSTRLQ